MIKSFNVDAMPPQDFIQKVTEALSGRDLGKIVTTSLDGNELLIAFSKMGKSEVRFAVSSRDTGFSCAHKSEKIALTHKMLRNEIESKLAKVLETVGAKVEQG